MKFNKKIVVESLNHKQAGKKVFTEGKKQHVVLSEDQFERLMTSLNEENNDEINVLIRESYKLIRESITNEGIKLNVDEYSDDLIGEGFNTGGYNPGVAAGEGIENVINGIKKAYDMIKDSDTRKKLANSITKLGNFMTITADAIASGRDQRSMADPDSLRDPLPYPELDETHHEEMEEGTGASSAGAYSAPLEFTEDTKPDFLDLDKDGDKEESMKKAAKDMKEDSGHDEAMNYGRDEGHDDKELYDLKHDGASEDHIEDLEDDMHYDHIHDSQNIEESKVKKEKLIQEDIKKMKQIIKPISKI